MSYSLDPKRKLSYIVIDITTPGGMEGIYAGTYEDCEMYMAEQAKYSSCIGMNIVPNPYYKQKEDLCKSCENHWIDFPLPLENAIPHCSIVDEKEGFKNMDEVVPYPCLECPFNCYKKKES